MDTKEAAELLANLPDVERIEVARLKPSDVIVLQFPKGAHASAEMKQNIEKSIKLVWPDNQVVVLTDGMTLKVVEGHGDPA